MSQRSKVNNSSSITPPLSSPLTERYGSEKRWLTWYRAEKYGKVTKIPRGSSTDPATWSTLDDLTSRNPGQPVGIVFTPDKLLLGIDIDKCLDPGTTTINHEQKETIAQFIIEADTYTEISPSKAGLHLFLELDKPLDLVANKCAPFEAYTSGRYFTVTHQPYKEVLGVRRVSTDEALRLLSIIGYPWKKESTDALSAMCQEENNKAPISSRLTDDEVLERMFKSKNGESIQSLYEGDTSLYNGDRSSADMALCSHLAFWTGGDAVQMDRLWLKSPLSNRDKAVVRKDYRPRTIATAIRNCKEFYSGNGGQQQGDENSVTEQQSSSNAAQTPGNSTKEKIPDKLVFLQSSTITSKPIDWLWDKKIAKGKVTLIAGDPGLGKSQVTIHLAATISTGGNFPGGSKATKGQVLFFSAEDDPGDTINPRLEAAGADLTRVHLFSTSIKRGKETSFDLSKDVSLLEKALATPELADTSLIIVDPITAFLGDTDSHVNAEVRALLSQLSKLASKHGMAIVVVTHLNKSSGGSPLNKITGSLAFIAAARAGYMVIKDENDDKRRLFLPVKNNLADDTGGFAFKLESYTLPARPPMPPIETSRVVWESEPVLISALDALRERRDDEGGVDQKTIEWLESYLRQYPDGAPFDQLQAAAARQGISKRTLYRAEKNVFIDKVYVGKNLPKKWRMVFDDKAVEEKDKEPLVDTVIKHMDT